MRTGKPSILCAIFLPILLYGCVGTARISDLPKSSSDIDFSKYSEEINRKKTPFWTEETSNEYYIEKEKAVSDTALVGTIEAAMRQNGYAIKSNNADSTCVIGQRGMRANEWGSVIGVYYKISPGKIQVYIHSKVTQDITGGARNNLAKKVGVLIEKAIGE